MEGRREDANHSGEESTYSSAVAPGEPGTGTGTVTLVQYRYPILVYCNGKKYTVPLNGKVLYTVQKHRESRGQKTQLSSRASVVVLPVFGW